MISGSILAGLHYVLDLGIVANLCAVVGDTAGAAVSV